MIEFLRQILLLVRPYRGRLILGIFCGVLGGLANPLLMVTVKLVTESVFPSATESADKDLVRALAKLEAREAVRLENIKQGGTAVQTAREIETQESLRLLKLFANKQFVSTNQALSELLREEIAIKTNNLARLEKEKQREQLSLEQKELEALRPLVSGEAPSKLQELPKIIRGMAAWFQEKFKSRNASPISDTEKVLIIATVPLAMLLRGLFTYLNMYMMCWVSIRAISDLRTKLFKHLLDLSLSFFHKTSTGELLTRFNDIIIIQNTISTSLSTIVKEPITIVSLVVLLVSQQPQLTLAALLVFPICIVPVVIFGRKMRKSAQDYQAHSVGMGKLLHESFTGSRIVKAYNLESTMVGEFRKTANHFISHYMRMVKATEIPGPMIEFFGAVGIAIFFLYIAFVTKKTPGDFLQFVGSLFLMYAPIKSLTRLHTQLEHARVACDEVFRILNTTPNVADPKNPVPIDAHNAEVQFDGITFNYDGKPVLQDVSFTVKPGQFVALVGSSGSGKTTLSNLLLRFYDPQKGRITIGGIDIRDVSQRDLRSQIAVVTQETILFNETIQYNIALGRPGAAQPEIEDAARHANAYKFIMEKDGKFNTWVGEKGANISGGQKQRIAIARAILKDAPILILDEATSSLDNESERLVQEALEDLMIGRTTICIAHRLSTVQKADVIYVLSQGRVVEVGTHAELLLRRGHYYRLYELDQR